MKEDNFLYKRTAAKYRLVEIAGPLRRCIVQQNPIELQLQLWCEVRRRIESRLRVSGFVRGEVQIVHLIGRDDVMNPAACIQIALEIIIQADWRMQPQTAIVEPDNGHRRPE